MGKRLSLTLAVIAIAGLATAAEAAFARMSTRVTKK